MTVTSSKTIDFSSNALSNNGISIVLDGDYHITLYGEEKTEFDKTELVYLKVSPPYTTNAYDIVTSYGSCIKFNQNNIEDVEDLLTFENESSAELSDIPIGDVTFEWVAGPEHEILRTDNLITISENIVGILKCTYQKEFDRLQLTVDQDMENDKVLVVVESDEKSSVTVEYTGNVSVLRDITLVIKDVITDDVITGAQITVSLENVQVFYGVSNDEGMVTIKDMIVGATYDLLVTATNYLDSNEDYLNNDSFTVPAEDVDTEEDTDV